MGVAVIATQQTEVKSTRKVDRHPERGPAAPESAEPRPIDLVLGSTLRNRSLSQSRSHTRSAVRGPAPHSSLFPTACPSIRVKVTLEGPRKPVPWSNSLRLWLPMALPLGAEAQGAACASFWSRGTCSRPHPVSVEGHLSFLRVQHPQDRQVAVCFGCRPHGVMCGVTT